MTMHELSVPELARAGGQARVFVEAVNQDGQRSSRYSVRGSGCTVVWDDEIFRGQGLFMGKLDHFNVFVQLAGEGREYTYKVPFKARK